MIPTWSTTTNRPTTPATPCVAISALNRATRKKTIRTYEAQAYLAVLSVIVVNNLADAWCVRWPLFTACMQRRSTDYVTAVLSTDCPVLHQSVSKQFNMSSNFLSTRPQFQFSRTAAMAKSRPGLPWSFNSVKYSENGGSTTASYMHIILNKKIMSGVSLRTNC